MKNITRRRFLELAAGSGAAGTLSGLLPAAAQPKKPKNVLFIAVDDLKPLLGCYGSKTVKSPNIDKLAARGMTFTRTYCQQATCAPSRNSLLTGLRPETIGIYDLSTNFRTKVPNVVTLPQYFKQNGYHTESMGKIFHTAQGNHDDPRSWSVPSQQKGAIPPEELNRPDAYKDFTAAVANDDNEYFEALEYAAFCGIAPQTAPPSAPPAPGSDEAAPAGRKNGPPTRSPNVPDTNLQDGKTANLAIERMNALKGGDKPFFLAVGFLKPHLPFVAPKKYWDLYKREDFTPDSNHVLPKGAPEFAGHWAGEASTYDGVPSGVPLPDDLARELMHGYHACVSYTDAQVGRVLAELDKLGLTDNTLVVLWGDHGWHLGDHGQWAKHTNFENAAHAPLIASIPGMKNRGATCEALTEFVDIYPSLVECAGLQMPDGLEGTSFAPLLSAPKTPWKTAAFHVWPRREKNKDVGLGRAMRTDRYRLCEWSVNGDPTQTVMELYDFVRDPLETVNLATLPENAKLVSELTTKLHAGWKAALPPKAAKK